MKAISQDTHGGPEVLREVELDRPVPGPPRYSSACTRRA